MTLPKILKTLLGAGALCGVALAVQAQNNITFQVDLTEQIQLGNFIPDSGVDTIRVTGGATALTDWGAGVDLTNNPALSGDASNIYSAVIELPGAPGATSPAYKFRMNGGWEDTANGWDRGFTIVGGDQVLPPVYYEDRPAGALTNANITFQVDMTPQVLTGGFTNGVSVVGVAGNINGWSLGVMTNDPALLGNASNIYSTTLTMTDTTVGMWSRFKFRNGGDWEEAAVTFPDIKNHDRQFFVAGGDQVLPLYTYRDASVCDLLLQETAVTFVLQITNGTTDNAGVPFDKASDIIHLNGQIFPGGWATWNTDLPQMTNNPVGSDFYEQTVVLAPGTARGLAFKFGISGPAHGGLDNEAPQFSDHVQYVRTFNPTFTMPVAQFGTNFAAIRVEPTFGNLKAGTPAAGIVPITWLGAPCVTLQTTTSLPATSWTDLPATDATSATNWPNAGGVQLFRLQKRPLP